MILTKFLEVKLTSKNFHFYKKYNQSDLKVGDILIIPIENLLNSNLLIDVKCDYCGDEFNMKYNTHLKSIKIVNKHACKKCSHLKKRDSFLKLYGVENPMFLDMFKNKIKKTNLEKYGVEHVFQSCGVIEKIKKTNLEKYGSEYYLETEISKLKRRETNLKKYGVEYTSQLKENRDKFKKTNLEKYGVDNYTKTDEYKIKSKKTNLERYGAENPMLILEFKEKLKKTNLERYGVEHALQNENILNRVKETMIDRYGVPYIQQNLDFRKRYKIDKNQFFIKPLSPGLSLFNCDNHKKHTFEISVILYHSRINNNIPLCTICNPVGDNRSFKEKELLSFVEGSKNIIESNYRVLGKEIDVYLPDLKLGFEFNGLYWHSDLYREKNYHLDKLSHFLKNGIRIFNVWEDDWRYKSDIVKPQINNLLNMSNRIYARNCYVSEVIDKGVTRDFLNKNHIQGDYPNIGKSFGLFQDDNLVSIMTFDHFEGRKKMSDKEWNLSRFCNKLNTTVVGGASRLLKHFINTYRPSRVISYADQDWSRGHLYERLGFRKIYETKPDYKYLVDDKRIHKSTMRKKRGETLSESQINKNLPKIWDCGKIKYEMLLG